MARPLLENDDRPSVSSPHSAPAAPRRGRGAAALVRLWWIALGNAALVLLAFGIAQAGGPGWRDAALWICAGSIAAARWADVVWLGGTTADGDPATLADWRRHAVLLLAATAVAWAVAHGLGRWLAS